MKKNSGNIEPLLVLCCLVGVVAFFCISLAFSAALGEKQEAKKLTEERERLMDELTKKENFVRDLARQIQDLESRIKEKEKSFNSAGQPQIQANQLEKELISLTWERVDLEKRIDLLRKQLAAFGMKPDPRKKEEKERELIQLTKLIEEIEGKIRNKKQEVASLPVQQGEQSYEDYEAQKRAIQNDIDRTRERARNTENQIKEGKVKLITGGESRHKKPLYVECRKDVYVFYPKGETVGAAEIEKKDIIAERISGHDIVVLIVRPDGFGSFGKAYGRARKLSIAICYEPMESHQPLDFLKG